MRSSFALYGTRSGFFSLSLSLLFFLAALSDASPALAQEPASGSTATGKAPVPKTQVSPRPKASPKSAKSGQKNNPRDKKKPAKGKKAIGKRQPSPLPSGVPRGVVIHPVPTELDRKSSHKGRQTPPKGPTSFELTRAAGGGKLILAFHSSDSKLVFTPQAGLAIQLLITDPIEVNPSIITEEAWPKGSNQMVLTYHKLGGAKPGQTMQVKGSASYRVCTRGTQQCKHARSNFELSFVP